MGVFDSIKNFWFPNTYTPTSGTQGQSTTNHNPNNSIARIQVDRVKQDIESWRNALKERERVWFPQSFKLQQLYADTVLNGHVQACISRRQNLVLQKDFNFVDVKTKQINEKLTDLFNKQYFYTIIKSILDAQLYGYSLIQWDKFENYELKDLRIIRRENISPDRKIVQPFFYSVSGKSWEDEEWKDWMLYTATFNEYGKSESGYGLLYNVAYYEIFLRNNMGYNADFLEKFIMPFVVAKTMKTEEDERGEMFNMLKNLASSNSALIDVQDEIEFIESKNSGSAYNSFDNFELRLEKKISKVLLGHADAIDSTSGQLGSNDEALIAMREIENSQISFVENEVNTHLLPKLRNLGFIIPDNIVFKFKNDKQEQESKEEEEEINQKTVTIVKTLFDAGIEVDPKWITERTKIPVSQIKVINSTDTLKAMNNYYGV
jgi:phage gp29-like protein